MTYQRVLSVHKNGTFRSGTDCCGGTVYFYYAGKSTAKNRIGEADFLMRQQRSRFHLPYIPECTLYAQAQTRSEYTDPPPIPPARSHLS